MTPRDRRQADKDRYQTYTLNANDIASPISYDVLLENTSASSNQHNQEDVKETKVSFSIILDDLYTMHHQIWKGKY